MFGHRAKVTNDGSNSDRKFIHASYGYFHFVLSIWIKALNLHHEYK